MHMADALVSPAVGGTLWVVTGGLLAWCARKVKRAVTGNLVPMMGVLGAFVFTAQMINFTIPGTGSSGHLGGGLLLAVLLGPWAAFLVIASVLTVQALFFADGGLLALGCNIFNLGFWPAFIAYPLLYRPIAGKAGSIGRAWAAAIVAAVVGLQLGAFSVVLETKASGISSLPFGMFTLLMLPIHLAIGAIEGLATAVVVSFVARANRGVLPRAAVGAGAPAIRSSTLIGLLAATVVVGGALSWFASTHPDGLEWSMARVAGSGEIAGSSGGIHEKLARAQKKTAILPDYGFRAPVAESARGAPVAAPGVSATASPAPGAAVPAAGNAAAEKAGEAWPAVDARTSAAGLVGGLLTLCLAGVIGVVLRPRRARPPAARDGAPAP